MKQKLFFILAVAVLATTPALAVSKNVLTADVEAEFGPIMAGQIYSDISNFDVFPGTFHMGVKVEVRSKEVAGILTHTYIYTISHDAVDSNGNPTALNIASVFSGLFDEFLDNGWISPGPTPTPFTLAPFYYPGDLQNPGSLTFSLNFPANWDTSHNVIGPALTIFAQASGTGTSPELFEFGYTGQNGLSAGFGSTLAPGDSGGGAGSPPIEGCSSEVTSIYDLKLEVAGLETSPWRKKKLTATLDYAQTALDKGWNRLARAVMAVFIGKVVRCCANGWSTPG